MKPSEEKAGIRISATGCRGVPATWGGIEHHCENIYSRLAEKGYDITVYARHYYTPKGVSAYKGIKVKRLPTLNLKYTDALFHTFLAVVHILIKNPDIIHFHGIGPSFFSFLPRLFRRRMKVFFTCNGLDWQRKKWPWWASRLIYLGELAAVYFAHEIIVVSRELEEYFARRHRLKTWYIPNGVTPLPRRKAEEIRAWGLGTRDYFLWVGRMVPEKRVEDIIKAYLLKPRGKKLVIVGDYAAAGNYHDFLKGLARGNQAVIFTGYQFGAVLQELYSNASAFVTASELEGLPITLLEALSYGTGCITSDIDPHREVMEPLSGPTFPVGDVSALAKCLDQAENITEDQRESFAQRAVSFISLRFSWDTIAGEHDRLFRKTREGGE